MFSPAVDGSICPAMKRMGVRRAVRRIGKMRMKMRTVRMMRRCEAGETSLFLAEAWASWTPPRTLPDHLRRPPRHRVASVGRVVVAAPSPQVAVEIMLPPMVAFVQATLPGRSRALSWPRRAPPSFLRRAADVRAGYRHNQVGQPRPIPSARALHPLQQRPSSPLPPLRPPSPLIKRLSWAAMLLHA